MRKDAHLPAYCTMGRLAVDLKSSVAPPALKDARHMPSPIKWSPSTADASSFRACRRLGNTYAMSGMPAVSHLSQLMVGPCDRKATWCLPACLQFLGSMITKEARGDSSSCANGKISDGRPTHARKIP